MIRVAVLDDYQGVVLPEFEEVRHLLARIANKNAGPAAPKREVHRYTTGKK